MKSSASSARWKRAQEYERGFWETQAELIADGATGLGWYRWRAEQLAKLLSAASLEELTTGEASVVEIGSGPVGVIAFFPAAHRVAIDPLADFYAHNQALSELRNPQVDYVVGVGEKIESASEIFDLAIAENCIDHVQNTGAVMTEIRRVLRAEGVLYLTVNCRSAFGFWVHRVLSALRIDAGHPHTYTLKRLKRFLATHRFAIVRLDAQPLWEAWRADLTSKEAKTKLKGLLGVSEFLVTVVARVRSS